MWTKAEHDQKDTEIKSAFERRHEETQRILDLIDDTVAEQPDTRPSHQFKQAS